MANPDILPYRLVSAAEVANLDSLEPALAHTINDPSTGETAWNEVHGIIRLLKAAAAGQNDWICGIVEAPDSTAVGTMSIRPLTDPTEHIHRYTTTAKPAEVTNAYFDPSVRGQGIGRRMLEWLAAAARTQGYTELLVRSGPRFMDTGWPVWDRLCGERVDTVQGYAIWRKVLEPAAN